MSYSHVPTPQKSNIVPKETQKTGSQSSSTNLSSTSNFKTTYHEFFEIYLKMDRKLNGNWVENLKDLKLYEKKLESLFQTSGISSYEKERLQVDLNNVKFICKSLSDYYLNFCK